MKVGDLIQYTPWKNNGRPKDRDTDIKLGIIISGPRLAVPGLPNNGLSWRIFWMYTNTDGWWDESSIEAIT